MKEEYLKQLQETYPAYPHISSPVAITDGDKWTEMGSPHTWLESSVTAGVVEVFTDVGYGRHSVFIDGELHKLFNNETVVKHGDDIYFIVDAPYYGFPGNAVIFKKV
jgi:hypothetical protein